MTKHPPRLSAVAVIVAAIGVAVLVGYVVLRTPEVPSTTLPPLSKTSATPQAAAPVSLTPVRKLLASGDQLTIGIYGDSTGDAVDEWVGLWAQHLAQTRRVSLYEWDLHAETFAPEPLVYGNSGPKVKIWNLSQPRASASYPVGKLQFGAEKLDLAIYNYGHNNTADNIAEQLHATTRAVAKRWGGEVPSVLILQNPERGPGVQRQTDTVDEVRSVVGPETETPVIDVWRAFMKSDTAIPALMSDEVHPNARGSRLWADTVIDAIG